MIVCQKVFKYILCEEPQRDNLDILYSAAVIQHSGWYETTSLGSVMKSGEHGVSAGLQGVCFSIKQNTALVSVSITLKNEGTRETGLLSFFSF